LLVDLTDNLDLRENKAVDISGLLDEIDEVKPDMILLEEASPFSEDSLMIRLIMNVTGLPVIVISEDSNLLHIVRCDTRLLSSSKDLIETIDLMLV
jgi:chemotaxis response regulator CheB